jgi:hypothetical protein
MRSPSLARLVETFRITTEQARLIKRLASATDTYPIRDESDRQRTLAYIVEHECPGTHGYLASLHSDPYYSHTWRVTVALHAMDGVLGTHGVEALGPGNAFDRPPPYEYLNTGDPCAPTLIYTRATDTLSIGAWLDIAERFPSEE